MGINAMDIKIAVASNVSYVMKDLKKTFMQIHPNIKVQVILGSSGKLVAQVKHAAPYDLFLSADMMFPQALYVEGFAVTKPVVYAKGALVILSQKERNYCSGLHVLKAPDVKTIAIANPKTAPYGKASVEALKYENLYETLKTKFVYGESISQTVAYTTTAADIGIIAKSSLYTPMMKKYKEGIHWTEIEEGLYTPISQGIVILKEGKEKAEVKSFYDFILSTKAKKILRDFGYSTL
jgi:molybdate transport system substrate-binding protein